MDPSPNGPSPVAEKVRTAPRLKMSLGGPTGRPSACSGDIFSLGAVLTFSATGEGPFGEGSTVALLYRVVTGEPNTQGVPDEIRPLIEHCLAKDPTRRPTAAQLLAQLSTAEVVADPAREGTTRKSAVPQPARQASAGAIGAAAGAIGAPAGANGAAAGAMASQAYPATQGPVVPPMRQGDGSDGRPTLSPSEAQRAYHERVTEGERLWSAQVPEAERYQGAQVPEAERYRGAQVPEAERYRGGPMPEAERYRGRPPGGSQRPRSSRRSWLIAVAAVVVLAVGAVAFLVGQAGHHSNSPGTVNAAASSAVASTSASTSGASSSPSATQATQLPGAAAMTTLGSDLARSAAVRPTVQAAIDNVQNCSESPSSGEAALQQAITTRQALLQGLATLDVSGLPNGAQLVSTLTTAMQNSLNADNDYHAWMADLVNAGSACGSNASQDSNYVAGGTASSAATTSKTNFLAIWNPMAPRYGQQTYSATGF